MIRSRYFDESVSRETFDNILKYHGKLLSENTKMALISKSSEEIAFQRHYEDSAQVIEYIEKQIVHYLMLEVEQVYLA